MVLAVRRIALPDKPNDNFERYFAEKIWEMIPAIYRHEDGKDIAENPNVLRAIVEILAEQAAILRRSHDRLWEDQFIELCDDWVVPYIANLLGTRLVSVLDERARRIDVAKTIYYRRRKGTLRVLEELISDITAWDGKVIENFRRLGRMRHGLDPKPADFAGKFTGTLPGGWADIRQQRGSELTDTPFDEYYHTADMRQHSGILGRYGIPKLAFHLYRLTAFEVKGVTACCEIANGTQFTFDPSGRDVPLFMPRNRTDNYKWDEWHSASEWELPAPIRCRLLGHSEYEIDNTLVTKINENFGVSSSVISALQTLIEVRFKSESRLRETLETLIKNADPGITSSLLKSIIDDVVINSIIDDCGKKALLPKAILITVPDPGGEGEITRENITAGNLENWSANISGKRLVIDPERGRFLFLGNAPYGTVIVDYHYGFSGEIGAGTYFREDVRGSTPNRHYKNGGALQAFAITNGVTYRVTNGITQIDDSRTYGPVEDLLYIEKLTLQAGDYQRPYIRLESDWVIDGADENSELVLDGLWIGGSSDYKIILTGKFKKVIIRHITIDPGDDKIKPVALIVEADVEEMTVDHSITGQIVVQVNGMVEKLFIKDSILQSKEALKLDEGEVHIDRTTIFGAVNVHRLWASEALITGMAQVTDTQNGCFRFGAALADSRLPKRYESYNIIDSNHYFTTRQFGQPGYAQLSQTAPVELLRGAENGSEIGAFSAIKNPIKIDSLGAKINEYMPFGLIPIFIYET